MIAVKYVLASALLLALVLNTGAAVTPEPRTAGIRGAIHQDATVTTQDVTETELLETGSKTSSKLLPILAVGGELISFGIKIMEKIEKNLKNKEWMKQANVDLTGRLTTITKFLTMIIEVANQNRDAKMSVLEGPMNPLYFEVAKDITNTVHDIEKLAVTVGLMDCFNTRTEHIRTLIQGCMQNASRLLKLNNDVTTAETYGLRQIVLMRNIGGKPSVLYRDLLDNECEALRDLTTMEMPELDLDLDGSSMFSFKDREEQIIDMIQEVLESPTGNAMWLKMANPVEDVDSSTPSITRGFAALSSLINEKVLKEAPISDKSMITDTLQPLMSNIERNAKLSQMVINMLNHNSSDQLMIAMYSVQSQMAEKIEAIQESLRLQGFMNMEGQVDLKSSLTKGRGSDTVSRPESPDTESGMDSARETFNMESN